MEQQVSGVIKDARVISKEELGFVVFGTVVKDYKGRFPEDGWIRTSIVTSGVKGDRIIKTLNSTYVIDNWIDEGIAFTKEGELIENT